jgi:uncharacterized membrane protein
MVMNSTVVTVHAVAATWMILLPPVQLVRRRKDRAHRWIGRSWVASAWTVCVSGMFIYTLTGGFTVFHALAIFTFATTMLGVIQIRRGRVRSHVVNMVGSWLGSVVAGAFAAFVPGREIPKLAVSDPALLWGIAGGTTVAVTAWVITVLVVIRPRRRAVPRLSVSTR